MANDGAVGWGCVVVLGFAALVYYGNHQDQEKVQSAARIAATEAKAKADAEKAAAEKVKEEVSVAINLAKSAHSLTGDWSLPRKADSELLSNDSQLRRRVSHMKGEMKIVGWEAKKYDDDTYIVSFTYEQHGRRRGWPFEVNIGAGVVREVVGDSELERKYGWSKGD